MSNRYFISENPSRGMIGSFERREILAKLRDGSFAPSFYCLPEDATGLAEVAWTRLESVFGREVGEVDAEPERMPRFKPRRRSPEHLALVGGFLALITGIVVRVQARDWAWPKRGILYLGDRADTTWAYNEALYIDLGLAAIAAGIGLILLGLWHRMR